MAADEEGFFEDWPKWSKPVFALSAMILLGGVWIGIPLLSALKFIGPSLQSEGQVNYQPMMAVLIAMTTATIAGIFLFMTFRIDRGTRLRAESEVKRALKDERKNFNEQLDAMKEKHETVASELRDIQLGLLVETRNELHTMYDEGTKANIVKSAVAERITDDALSKHIESTLMVDANSQLVAEYAKKHAPKVSEDTAKVLVKLLNDTVKSLSRHAKAKRKERRKESRARVWAGVKARLVDWWRRVTRRRG